MSASNSNPTGPGQPVTTVSTSELGAAPGTPVEPILVHGASPAVGTTSGGLAEFEAGQSNDANTGKGVDGEEDVWVGRYSMMNFLGRILLRVFLTILVIAMAVKAGDDREYNWLLRFSQFFGIVVGAMWLYLAFRMVRAWYSHYYRLTNRRLFVSTGVIRRRRDMMELLRVKDVTTSQNSLLERWLGLGLVSVVSTEKGAPVFHLPGVRDPKQVLDLIWHHARKERDLRSVKVDHI